MAGVVDEGSQRAIVLIRDARDQDGIIRGALRIETAYELFGRIVPEIPVAGKCAAASAIKERHRLSTLPGFGNRGCDPLAKLVQIARNQVAARQVHAI